MDIAGKLPPHQITMSQSTSEARFALWDGTGPEQSPALCRLTFGELEPLASAFLAILFALVLAGVAGQEAELLQPASQLRVELHQGPGNPEAACARLTDNAAALRQDEHVELLDAFRSCQRLPYHGP